MKRGCGKKRGCHFVLFLLRRSGGAKGPFSQSRENETFTLTPEMILELSPDGGLTTQARMKLVRDLVPVFKEQPLQEVNQIELIWYKTKDLLGSDDHELRAELYSFYQVNHSLAASPILVFFVGHSHRM